MQNEPPDNTEVPEQILNGAPGPTITNFDGLYKIYWANRLVDMALNGDSAQVHNVKLFRDNNEPESTWHFYYDPDKERYQITNGWRQDLWLGRNNNDSVIAAPFKIDLGYYWLLKSAGNGFYYIENKFDGKVMDVKGANVDNNTDIILYPCHEGVNQKFMLRKI